jgi:hypothetical protein
MSPIRLYRIACSVEVLASVHLYHHPIRRYYMMPTPSHPTKSWIRLFAVTRICIVMRKNSRYLRNWLMLGSECMYHRENSMIDHVTNRATGMNSSEQ